MSRDEWIGEVYAELNRQACAQRISLTAGVKEDNMNWAIGLAEAYYDENPGEYTPKEAIREDLYDT